MNIDSLLYALSSPLIQNNKLIYYRQNENGLVINVMADDFYNKHFQSGDSWRDCIVKMKEVGIYLIAHHPINAYKDYRKLNEFLFTMERSKNETHIQHDSLRHSSEYVNWIIITHSIYEKLYKDIQYDKEMYSNLEQIVDMKNIFV